MCRLARTRSMRNAYIAAGVSSIPAFLAASARELRIYAWKTTQQMQYYCTSGVATPSLPAAITTTLHNFNHSSSAADTICIHQSINQSIKNELIIMAQNRKLFLGPFTQIYTVSQKVPTFELSVTNYQSFYTYLAIYVSFSQFQT